MRCRFDRQLVEGGRSNAVMQTRDDPHCDRGGVDVLEMRGSGHEVGDALGYFGYIHLFLGTGPLYDLHDVMTVAAVLLCCSARVACFAFPN